MATIRFEVIGRPQQRGSKRAFVRGGKPVVTDMNKKSSSWMQQVRESAAEAMGGRDLIRRPVVLSVVFRFARPKSHYGTGRNAGRLKDSAPGIHSQTPDLAKLVRCLEDALTGVVWADDRQVYCYSLVRRQWTEGSEGCSVHIVEDEQR